MELQLSTAFWNGSTLKANVIKETVYTLENKLLFFSPNVMFAFNYLKRRSTSKMESLRKDKMPKELSANKQQTSE